MADDNHFSLGDILWEYADYTPPETPAGPSVPLPPEAPQAPKPPAAAPAKPGITSPQPVSPAPAAPPAPKPAAPRPASQPLPANQSLPANQAPAKKTPPAQSPKQDPPQEKAPAPAPASPTPQPADEPAPSPDTPPEGEQAAPAPEAPAPEEAPAPSQDETEVGVPQDDGPELIAFTPDPKAAAQQAQDQPATPEGDGAAEQPPMQGPPAPGQTGQAAQGPQAPGQGTPTGPKAAPGGQTVPPGKPQTPPQEGTGFHPFRERKARAEAPPPPDAPPAQLAEEYGLGLQALKGKCTAAGVLSAVLLLFALLDSGVLPVLDSLLPANILLLGSLALFAGCVLLSLDVLKEGLVQLTNLAPNGDTLALFAALFTLVDGVTMVFTPLRESAIPFFSPCALVLTFHLLGRYCDRSAKFQACRVAASVSQPYLVTQDPNVLGGRTAFRKWLGVPKGFGSQIRTTSQAEARFRRLTPVLLVACFCLSLVTTVAHHQPNLVFWSLSALFTAAATLGVSLALNLPLRMLGGKLAKLGVALAGWPGLLAGKGCKAALLLDQDIYPPGTVALAGSRVFGSLSMERTVAFTASVIRASGSGLTYLFDKLVRAEGSGYLPIEKIVMQETGLLGQCQGQQILVGNSDFMSRQGIALPPGIRAKDAVFCAVDRELVGMFVLKYTLHPAITPALQSMVLHRIAPVMVTRDFNLNPHRLRLWGRLPMDQLTFPDLQRRVTLSGPNQPHGPAILAVLCREGIAPFSQALIGAKRIRRAAAFSSFFVNFSACVGVVLTASLSSAGALGAMCAWHLSLFLLLWLVPVLLISLWTTQY